MRFWFAPEKKSDTDTIITATEKTQEDGLGGYTPVINYYAGGLTTKETRRIDSDEVLYLKAPDNSMTSGHLVVSIFGG